jgi:hypothetical protein
VTAAWRADAACAGHPRSEWWDATVDGETHAQAQARHGRAIGVCATCPVKDACLAEALTARPRVEGVWGGQVLEGLAAHAKRRFVQRDRGIDHGTEGGHQAHRRRGERPCNACMGAARRAQQARRARKQAAS